MNFFESYTPEHKPGYTYLQGQKCRGTFNRDGTRKEECCKVVGVNGFDAKDSMPIYMCQACHNRWNRSETKGEVWINCCECYKDNCEMISPDSPRKNRSRRRVNYSNM
jgi:hypothetical protein